MSILHESSLVIIIIVELTYVVSVDLHCIIHVGF